MKKSMTKEEEDVLAIVVEDALPSEDSTKIRLRRPFELEASSASGAESESSPPLAAATSAAAAAARTAGGEARGTRTARALQSSSIHEKDAEEGDADNSSGLQGGQLWESPTRSPTVIPSVAPTGFPTTSPTYYPVPRGELKTLKGDIWYDRNANGERDSNVDGQGILGDDVEYRVGLGGVQTTLWTCGTDGEDALDSDGYPVGSAMVHSASSAGVDITFKPVLGPGAGRFTFTNIEVSTSYFVRVEETDGYLLTSGICNNDYVGWSCDDATTVPVGEERDVGIPSGRTACVDVDRQGFPNEHLTVGIMRKNDLQNEKTSVALVLDFDKSILRFLRSTNGGSGGKRGREGLQLADEDKQAIGAVTAEVLAGSLDEKLSEVGVELDGVVPQGVIVAEEGETTDQLAVALEIKGHYTPPPIVDFAFVVQQSINAETESIRRNLREYNTNCQQQTSLIKSGQASGAQDFLSAVDHTGRQSNLPSRKNSNAGLDAGSSSPVGDVFHDACNRGLGLPSIFDTSLKQIEVSDVKGIDFDAISDVVGRYVEPEKSAFADWAIGPVAALSGLIAMLSGAFVFRRAVGTRRMEDKYREKRCLARNIDSGEKRRFGEMGGCMDDGSVDSAFYSDCEDDEYAKKMGKKCRDGDAKRKDKNMRTLKREKTKMLKKAGKSGRNLLSAAKSSRKLTNENEDGHDEKEPLSGKAPKSAMKRGFSMPLKRSFTKNVEKLKGSFTNEKENDDEVEKKALKSKKSSLRSSSTSDGTQSIGDSSDNSSNDDDMDDRKPAAKKRSPRKDDKEKKPSSSSVASSKRERAAARKKVEQSKSRRKVLGTDDWENRDVKRGRKRGERSGARSRSRQRSSSVRSERSRSRSHRDESQSRRRSRSASKTRGRSRASGGDNARILHKAKSLV